MPSRVIVKMTGSIGIDDVDRLLADLAKESGLDWREERLADGPRLGGGEIVVLLTTSVISGVAGKGAEAAVEAAVDRVREVVSRWRERRVDPPDAEVETQDVPQEQPAPGNSDGPDATGTAG